MDRPQAPSLDFGSFKNVKPQAMSLRTESALRTRKLEGLDAPLVLEPATEGVDLADWARANRDFLDARLHEHGALLFKGFGLGSTATFEAFASSICPDLFNENGEHPRETVSGKVYTPVFYPSDQKLLMHNENSFNHRWPGKIFFACATPPEKGGETPIADSRRVYERVAPEVRRRFEELGVLYVRNYHPDGVGLDWQQVYNTDSRKEVEARCRTENVELDWCDDGRRLRTRARRPGVIRHPRSGEPSWFNQAQHWHLSCLDPETRRSMEDLYAVEDLPRHCYYGDGSPIEDEVMAEVLRIYDEEEIALPWSQGDAMLLDNILVAHGRNPYQGARKILVAMGDMTSFDDVEGNGGVE